MSDKNKRIIGGMSVLALIAVITVSIQSGGMKGLNGRDLTNIAPAAGEAVHREDAHGITDTHAHDYERKDFDWGYDASSKTTDCGVHEDWIANPVDEDVIKETGKAYRIIGLGDAVTMDHNPMRINVYLNANGIVVDVRCG